MCLWVHGQLHLLNSLFMMLDVFVGGLPFEWKHMSFTFVYGISCEKEEKPNTVDSEYQSSLEVENLLVACLGFHC